MASSGPPLIPRHELVAAALSLGVPKPESMTSDELTRSIQLASESGEVRTANSPGWFEVARHLMASVMGQGLNMPEAARLILGPRVSPKQRAPLPTVTLAQIYLSQGHLERARATLSAVLSREPENAKARSLLAGMDAGEQYGLFDGRASDEHESAPAAGAVASSESGESSKGTTQSAALSEGVASSESGESSKGTTQSAASSESGESSKGTTEAAVGPSESVDSVSSASSEGAAASEGTTQSAAESSESVPVSTAPSEGVDSVGVAPSKVRWLNDAVVIIRGPDTAHVYWDLCERTAQRLPREKFCLILSQVTPGWSGATVTSREVPITEPRGVHEFPCPPAVVVRGAIAVSTAGGWSALAVASTRVISGTELSLQFSPRPGIDDSALAAHAWAEVRRA